MRAITAVCLGLVLVGGCSPSQQEQPPTSTVFDPMIQAEQKAKQAEQALQADQKRQAEAIDQQSR